VNKKFSTRYYLNLVLIDEENRRYFKQQVLSVFVIRCRLVDTIPVQEITVFRIPEVGFFHLLQTSLIASLSSTVELIMFVLLYSYSEIMIVAKDNPFITRRSRHEYSIATRIDGTVTVKYVFILGPSYRYRYSP
jgi:hypothetical protein